MLIKEEKGDVCVDVYTACTVLYVRQEGYVSQHPRTPCNLPDPEEAAEIKVLSSRENKNKATTGCRNEFQGFSNAFH